MSEEEPLAPEVIVSPVSDPKVSLPCNTVSVSESEVPTAPPSVALMGSPADDEKVYAPFSRTFAVAGAVTYGLTEIRTEATPLSLSMESASESASESWPLNPEVGV